MNGNAPKASKTKTKQILTLLQEEEDLRAVYTDIGSNLYSVKKLAKFLGKSPFLFVLRAKTFLQQPQRPPAVPPMG